MGTSWSAVFGNPGMRPLEPLQRACELALAALIAQMSPWEPDSDISRYNRAAPGSRHLVPADFEQVLRHAMEHARDSSGAFDPAIGALVDAWGFGPRADANTPAGRDEPPSHAALTAARHRSGWEKLDLDADAGLLQPGGLSLDFSGIAKGFAVDRLLEVLRAHGHADALVEIGGDVRASGSRPNRQPWRIAIARPDAPAQALLTLPLCDMAVATSGDTWHAFEHAGRRYSHTLDPRTGEPITHALASVTVLHAECVHADALATVLTVLGTQDGLPWATERGLAALFVDRQVDGGLAWQATTAFEALLRP